MITPNQILNLGAERRNGNLAIYWDGDWLVLNPRNGQLFLEYYENDCLETKDMSHLETPEMIKQLHFLTFGTELKEGRIQQKPRVVNNKKDRKYNRNRFFSTWDLLTWLRLKDDEKAPSELKYFFNLKGNINQRINRRHQIFNKINPLSRISVTEYIENERMVDIFENQVASMLALIGNPQSKGDGIASQIYNHFEEPKLN